MHHHASRNITIGGYILLGAALLTCIILFTPQITFSSSHVWEIILSASAACAIAAFTVTTFFVWDENVSEKLEARLGPIGHVLHCGYCLSLWFAAGTTSLLGLSFLPSLPFWLNFAFSWWTLGAVTIFIHEIIGIGWFYKNSLYAQSYDRFMANRKLDDLTNAKDLQ